MSSDLATSLANGYIPIFHTRQFQTLESVCSNMVVYDRLFKLEKHLRRVLSEPGFYAVPSWCNNNGEAPLEVPSIHGSTGALCTYQRPVLHGLSRYIREKRMHAFVIKGSPLWAEGWDTCETIYQWWLEKTQWQHELAVDPRPLPTHPAISSGLPTHQAPTTTSLGSIQELGVGTIKKKSQILCAPAGLEQTASPASAAPERATDDEPYFHLPYEWRLSGVPNVTQVTPNLRESRFFPRDGVSMRPTPVVGSNIDIEWTTQSVVPFGQILPRSGTPWEAVPRAVDTPHSNSENTTTRIQGADSSDSSASISTASLTTSSTISTTSSDEDDQSRDEEWESWSLIVVISAFYDVMDEVEPFPS